MLIKFKSFCNTLKKELSNLTIISFIPDYRRFWHRASHLETWLKYSPRRKSLRLIPVAWYPMEILVPIWMKKKCESKMSLWTLIWWSFSHTCPIVPFAYWISLNSVIATMPMLKLTRSVYALKNPRNAIITTIYRRFRQNRHDNGSTSGFIVLLLLGKNKTIKFAFR